MQLWYWYELYACAVAAEWQFVRAIRISNTRRKRFVGIRKHNIVAELEIRLITSPTKQPTNYHQFNRKDLKTTPLSQVKSSNKFRWDETPQENISKWSIFIILYALPEEEILLLHLFHLYHCQDFQHFCCMFQILQKHLLSLLWKP